MRMQTIVRPPFTLSPVLGLGLATALGCGTSGQEQLSLGQDDGGPSFAFAGGDANTSGALDAYIENSSHLAVKFVTLSCSGDCATVEAVGTGGYPPYTFKWDDGSISATRKVCPTSTTSYSVKVTDTGTVGELARAPETMQVPLTANVIACPDGGPSDAAPGDGSVSGCMTLTNPFVSASSCPDEGGATYGTFMLPFPLEEGASYTMTLIPTLASTTTAAVTFYGLTAACGLDTLGTITVPANNTMPQSACLHPQETLSSIAMDFIGWTNTMTFCSGCAAP